MHRPHMQMLLAGFNANFRHESFALNGTSWLLLLVVPMVKAFSLFKPHHEYSKRAHAQDGVLTRLSIEFIGSSFFKKNDVKVMLWRGIVCIGRTCRCF